MTKDPNESSIEDAINKSLGIDDEGNDVDTGSAQVQDGGQSDEDQGGQEDAAQGQGKDKGAAGANKDKSAASNADGKGGTKDGQGQQGKDKKGGGGPKPVLDANGRPIAEGGAQRRLFEKAQNLEKVVIPGLEAQIKAYKEASNFAQFGLTAAEAITGMQIIQQMKTNPAQTIKYLLTTARAQGHNIDLGEGSAGVDIGAIKKMIEEATKPLAEAKQARDDRQKAEQEAQQEYDAFVSRRPDAEVHEAAIARLISSDSSLSLDAAYFQLKHFYAENGLDWNVPLQKHLEAAQKAREAGGSGRANGGQSGGKPRNNGRGAMTIGAGGQLQDTEDDAENLSMPANASFDDIINASLKQHGYAR